MTGSRLSVGVLTLVACLCACIFCFEQQANADDVYASIRGTVTDSTGAVVPGVALTATNVGTGVTYKAASADDGHFAFLQLPIGEYTVKATKQGFSSFATTKIHLDSDQIYSLNPALKVGTISEEVVVNANAAQVESTSMQLGDVVSGQEIADAPLVTRNWVQLQQLEPGVVGQSDRFANNYSTNGSESQQNAYLINGMDSADIATNTPLITPSPDALSEFRLVTSTINPEYGRNSGAILNAVIKSGSDQFHGDAFEFFRDTSLNGRDYFQIVPAPYHQNLYGGTIGGPIWKRHTFFFFSYQGSRFTQPQTFTQPTVPTAAEEGGDFSACTTTCPGANGKSSAIPLFGDSASPCPVSSGTPCVAGTPYATLFSTNVIPSQDFNTVATGLVTKFVPTPNFGSDKFTFNPTNVGSTTQYLFRIDHTFNPHDTIWEYSLFQHNPRQDTLPFAPSGIYPLPGFGEQQQVHEKELVGAWQHTFGASILNEMRWGYQRLNFNAVEPQKVVLPSALGFTGIAPQNAAGASYPFINVSGQSVNFALGFSELGPEPRIDETYQAGDSLSLVRGKHTIKIGYEGRRFENHNPYSLQNNGFFSFAGAGAFSTGNEMADLLLGIPDSYAQTSGGYIEARAYEHYVYAQDQFKATPNLSLTFGLGWDINTPMSQLANQGESLNCFTPNAQSTIFPTAPTGLLFPGDKGCTAQGYSTHFTDFGPRVGLAWSPDWGWISGGAGKLSIRAGYGIYYNRGNSELTLQFLLDPPFTISDLGIGDVGGSPSFIAPFTDVRCIDQSGNSISGGSCAGLANPSIPNKYPFSPPARGSAVNFSAYEPFGLATIDPKFRAPYAENYNLTVQRELPGSTIMTLAYVGSSAHRLETWYERNPGLPGQCAAVAACVGQSPFNYWQAPYNLPPFHQYDSTIFGSIGTMATLGHSNYNSFQASLNKRLTHGLSFLASYTYAHALDNSSSFEDHTFNGLGMDPFNFNRYYGSSAYDARQRLVLSYSYAVPKIPALTHGWADRLVNGWRISGITTFQGGLPVSIFNQIFSLVGGSSGTCPGSPVFVVGVSCWDTVNVNGPVQVSNPRATGNFWFNPSTFSNPCAPVLLAAGTCIGTPITDPGTGGNAGRNFFHGPGLNQWDFQLTKGFAFSEAYRLELRAELYNVFNHTQFANPDGNFADGPSFGTIGGIQGLPREVQLAVKFYF